MAIKDLDMAIELANSFDSERLFGDLAKKLFIDAEKVGMGKLDQTAILTYLLNDQWASKRYNLFASISYVFPKEKETKNDSKREESSIYRIFDRFWSNNLFNSS